MAKLKHGIFGPLSGKLGPVVGATWMGIPYLRQAPKKSDRAKPRSAAQIANEQKLKFVNIVLVPFHPYVTVGFNNLAIQKTAISAGFSANYHQAITGIYPNLGVDYSKMIISKGELPGLSNPNMKFIAQDLLEFTWQNGTDITESYDDQLMLVLYAPELHIADGFIGGTKRAERHRVFKLDPQLIGKALEVYISVTSLSRKKISNSLYMGRILP